MLRKLVTTIIGDPNERELDRHRKIVEVINEWEAHYKALSDADMHGLTEAFRARLRTGETLDDLLPEAFAAVREAARRTTGMRPYDVQMIGAIVLHKGQIAEMKTGEGKTLVASMTLFLNALEDKGVHLVTPNDYLSKYGVQWMGPIYHLLGMRAGIIQNKGADPTKSSFIFDPDFASDDERYQYLRPVSRREAYKADITYGTNNEFGFDYLRDNMAVSVTQQVQRSLHFAIVDEVDNILIDEARTPLIISGPAEESSPYYRVFAQIVPRLKPSSEESIEIEEPDGDYAEDVKARGVTLTHAGIEKVEAELRKIGEIDAKVQAFLESKANDPEYHPEDGYLFAPEFSELTPYLDSALRAHVIYERDRDYIVQDGQVIIVDEFTGRLMHGRRYSEGLHQSIEAKEGVKVRRENLTMATITFQNYFRMYEKLAGMTGTAITEQEEFEKTYDLDVTVIPTHEPVIREDMEDHVYISEKAKFTAAVDEIKRLHEAGRPVLVGTASIDTSERISKLLKRAHIPHNVLNAKQHEREAIVIAQAGKSGTVTIATNMAGRGVDILLGGNPKGIARDKLRKQDLEITQATPEQWAAALAEAEAECQADRERVLAAGGLHVLGTERHEARRIDNQLRGRAGRQGDVGSSQFFLSLEDNLMRRFGGERLKGYMSRISKLSQGEFDESMPITHSWISKTIAQAQKRVEGYNFDIRKRVLEYDDVVNKQREVIYAQRTQVLRAENLRDQVTGMVEAEVRGVAAQYLTGDDAFEWRLDALRQAMLSIFPLPSDITVERWEKMAREDIIEQLVAAALARYAAQEARYAEETVGDEPFMRFAERRVLLRVVDKLWVQHLTDLDVLREGIGLQAYGNRDPLVEYKREAHHMWEQMLGQIQSQVVQDIFRVGPQPPQAEKKQRRTREYRPNIMGATAPPEPVRADVWDKVKRNDPCPCGSGKKYKHCCYRKRQEARQTIAPSQVKRSVKRRRRR